MHHLVREAGYAVFYDNFYADHLWGKDLPTFFDEIYRKKSLYCVPGRATLTGGEW